MWLRSFLVEIFEALSDVASHNVEVGGRVDGTNLIVQRVEKLCKIDILEVKT